MSHNNPPIRNAVIATLKEHDPMTCADTAGLMGWTVERVHGVIANARRLRPGQIFRVVGYQRATDGKGKDASIYAAQAGNDVPRPVVDKSPAQGDASELSQTSQSHRQHTPPHEPRKKQGTRRAKQHLGAAG